MDGNFTFLLEDENVHIVNNFFQKDFFIPTIFIIFVIKRENIYEILSRIKSIEKSKNKEKTDFGFRIFMSKND